MMEQVVCSIEAIYPNIIDPIIAVVDSYKLSCCDERASHKG